MRGGALALAWLLVSGSAAAQGLEHRILRTVADEVVPPGLALGERTVTDLL